MLAVHKDVYFGVKWVKLTTSIMGKVTFLHHIFTGN